MRTASALLRVPEWVKEPLFSMYFDAGIPSTLIVPKRYMLSAIDAQATTEVLRPSARTAKTWSGEDEFAET